MSELFTPKQVADKLQLHINTVYRYIEEGKLKSIRLGDSLLRIKESDLEDFINDNTNS